MVLIIKIKYKIFVLINKKIFYKNNFFDNDNSNKQLK